MQSGTDETPVDTTLQVHLPVVERGASKGAVLRTPPVGQQVTLLPVGAADPVGGLPWPLCRLRSFHAY
eukprot:5358737-Pyramimonas_sp.AAC.1